MKNYGQTILMNRVFDLTLSPAFREEARGFDLGKKLELFDDLFSKASCFYETLAQELYSFRANPRKALINAASDIRCRVLKMGPEGEPYKGLCDRAQGYAQS